jgi:hypothetical protein
LLNQIKLQAKNNLLKELIIMKLIKLILATVLGTAALGIAFTESAQAYGSYSSRGQDSTTIGATFDLFDETTDGTPIVDTNPLNDIGFFEGAIQNYDPTGNIDSGSGIPVADILVTNFVPVANFQATLNSNTITYQILQQGNGSLIEQFVLDLTNIQNGNFIVEERNNSDVIFPEINIANFNINSAVNDLSYILDNNLLGATNPVIDGFTGGRDTILEEVVDNPVPPTTSVPESSTTNSLLILGLLGTGALLKRRLKNTLA